LVVCGDKKYADVVDFIEIYDTMQSLDRCAYEWRAVWRAV